MYLQKHYKIIPLLLTSLFIFSISTTCQSFQYYNYITNYNNQSFHVPYSLQENQVETRFPSPLKHVRNTPETLRLTNSTSSLFNPIENLTYPNKHQILLETNEIDDLGIITTNNLTIPSLKYNYFKFQNVTINRTLSYWNGSDLESWFINGFVWGINFEQVQNELYSLYFSQYGGLWRSYTSTFPVVNSSLLFSFAFSPLYLPASNPLYLEFDFDDANQIFYVFYNQTKPSLQNDTNNGLYFFLKDIYSLTSVSIQIDFSSLLSNLGVSYSQLTMVSFYSTETMSLLLEQFIFDYSSSYLPLFTTYPLQQEKSNSFILTNYNDTISISFPVGYLLTVTLQVGRTLVYPLILSLQMVNQSLRYQQLIPLSLNVSASTIVFSVSNNSFPISIIINNQEYLYTTTPLQLELNQTKSLILNIYITLQQQIFTQITTHLTSTLTLPQTYYPKNYSIQAILTQNGNYLLTNITYYNSTILKFNSSLFSYFAKGNLSLYIIPLYPDLPVITYILILTTQSTYLQSPNMIYLYRWIQQTIPIFYYDHYNTLLTTNVTIQVTMNSFLLNKVSLSPYGLQITQLFLPSNSYNLTLHFEKKGYQNQTITIQTVLTNPELALSFYPQSSNFLVGQAFLNNNPTSNISIYLYSSQTILSNALTNRTGHFTFFIPPSLLTTKLNVKAYYYDLSISYNLSSFLSPLSKINSFSLIESSPANSTSLLILHLQYPKNGSFWELMIPRPYIISSYNASIQIFNITQTSSSLYIQFHANRTTHDTDTIIFNLGTVFASYRRLITTEQWIYSIRLSSPSIIYNASLQLPAPTNVQIKNYSLQTNMTTAPIFEIIQNTVFISGIKLSPHSPLSMTFTIQFDQVNSSSSSLPSSSSYGSSPLSSSLLLTSISFTLGLSPTIVRKIKTFYYKKQSEFILQL